MTNDLSVSVCYNEPVSAYDNYLGKDIFNGEVLNDLSEKGFFSGLNVIKESLEVNFKIKDFIPFGIDIPCVIEKIKESKPDLIFNFVESVNGKASFESCAAGLFELLEIRYTGNPPLTLGNCLDKAKTKRILTSLNIPTPDFLIVDYKASITRSKLKLKFPLIVKLLAEDASIGISEFSVVRNFNQLTDRINFLFKNFKQSVIVEKYINGREFNVAILDGEPLPISEISFKKLPKKFPKIVTYEGKWAEESDYFKSTIPVCPAKISNKTKTSIIKTALHAYEALDCRDYARVDIRLDSKNKPYVIEVNPNPDISLDSGFVRSAKAAGIDYPELLKKIAYAALSRN